MTGKPSASSDLVFEEKDGIVAFEAEHFVDQSKSGKRAWCLTRNQWLWKSAQRNEKVHAGVPGILTLDVPKEGKHTIQVSVRENGIALAKVIPVDCKDCIPKSTSRQKSHSQEINLQSSHGKLQFHIWNAIH